MHLLHDKMTLNDREIITQKLHFPATFLLKLCVEKNGKARIFHTLHAIPIEVKALEHVRLKPQIPGFTTPNRSSPVKELKHTRALRGLIGAEASRDLRLLLGRLESRIERLTND